MEDKNEIDKSEVKDEYNDSIDNYRDDFDFSGGSIVIKKQNDGTGNCYGPYAWLVSPPSAGRKWHYLGPVSGSSDTGETVGKSKQDDENTDPEGLVQLKEEYQEIYEQYVEEIDTNDELIINKAGYKEDSNALLLDVEHKDSGTTFRFVDMDVGEIESGSKQLEIISEPTNIGNEDAVEYFERSGFSTPPGISSIRDGSDIQDQIELTMHKNNNKFRNSQTTDKIDATEIVENDYGDKKVKMDLPEFDAKDTVKDKLDWEETHHTFHGGVNDWYVDYDSLDYVKEQLADTEYGFNDVTDEQVFDIDIEESNIKRLSGF